MTDTPNPPPNPPAPGSTPAPQPGAAPGEELIADPADVEKNKVFAILAYLGLLVLIPLFVAKESPFARYHTNQGLILLLAGIASGVLVGIIAGISIVVTALLHIGIAMCCVSVLGLAQFAFVAVFVVMGIINAANGKMKPLPVIGKFTLIK